MNVEARLVEFGDVEAMRELYRQEANCQIIHDSFLRRGLAEPYLILLDDRPAGYGAVGNRYPKNRVTEFYTLPRARRQALPMFRELLAVSQARTVEAQTNMALMLSMLYDVSKNVTIENIIFQDAYITDLPNPGGVFRQATTSDRDAENQWVVEVDGVIAAKGGFLCHYNPPYGDVFMETAEPFRRQGYGSYLVQEIKRVCCEAGKKPAARCNPTNYASRRTLEKAGFLPCGRMLAGKVRT
jgi:GNAT superfamily N-acetyltransferase